MERALDRLFADAIGERTFPGGCLLVGQRDSILLERAWGLTHYEGGATVDHRVRYDLASLTKPLVTAALCLRAIGDTTLRLEDRLRRFFPARWLSRDKADITLLHLLNHCSGLPAYEPFYLKLMTMPESRRRETLLTWILDTPLRFQPGAHCTYSDLGFILLGMLLERELESPLDALVEMELFVPLQIEELTFRRLHVGTIPTVLPRVRIPSPDEIYAPTEECPWRKRLLVGEVHDENGYALGGVAGHAGLFGTARSIFRLLSHLLNVYRGVDQEGLFDRETLRVFWSRPGLDPVSSWALGFDTPSPNGSSSGSHFSSRSVGHLGYTGTSFWMDLERELCVILLTNRVHPTRDNDRIKTFRPRLHDLVMKGLHEHKEV